MPLNHRDALERRYDGPIPHNASVAPDADQPMSVQISHRRQWAWREVKRIGGEVLRARRNFNRFKDIKYHYEWNSRRKELGFMLEHWRRFYDIDQGRDAIERVRS